MSIQMHVKSILIVTKAYEKSMITYTAVIARFLLAKGYIVYVESHLETDGMFDAPKIIADAEDSEQARKHLRYWTPELCSKRPHLIDFVITLGGDGTVLYASWLFQRVAPPTLSFSLGSLGFLTKFDFDHHEQTLTRAFNEGVTIGLRLRFEGTVMRSIPTTSPIRDLCDEILTPESPSSPPTHHRGESFIILNEIVVDRGPNPTLSTTELYGDNMFLTSIAADGVCIATPTGSTAYSLAAGGSLVHPELPAMLVSVICAHSLTFRPLILPDSMVLRIGVPYNARTSSWVSFDGRMRTELKQGDYVSIIASRFPFPIIQCKRDNMDWFDSLRRTMNWGARAGQKPFDHKM
ncbi:putative NAD kinase [Ascodesmis nigricans]|uniref:Putative NAD kinase n=1 Tax=Ascodesmis nigricans TaxID=341454 RepID=A0A4S2MVG1_9PEZI|nr:putative NAD kinase [Ascodesmis nigricans]